MAEAYGTIDNPVPLDPFTWLTEVHWVSPFLLITYGIVLIYTPQGETGIGPGPAFVEPFSEGFVLTTTPAFSPSQPNIKRWDGSSFVNLSNDDVELSGAPSPPDALSFGAWHVNGIDSGVPGGSSGPTIAFLSQSGSHPDVKLPDATTFFTALSADGEVKGQSFISEPQPAPIGGTVPLWATYDPEMVQQGTFTISVSGLSAVWKEKTYTPIATRTSSQTLAILMKKQATPPSP